MQNRTISWTRLTYSDYLQNEANYNTDEGELLSRVREKARDHVFDLEAAVALFNDVRKAQQKLYHANSKLKLEQNKVDEAE